MLSRHDISDEHWNRIQPLKAGQAGQHGSVGHVIQLFINAIRFLANTGIAWAHLHTCPPASASTTVFGSATTAGVRTARRSRSHPLCVMTTPNGPTSTAVAFSPMSQRPARNKYGGQRRSSSRGVGSKPPWFRQHKSMVSCIRWNNRCDGN